jgi:pimeloyl-ACP methyl ester carboxylesterase
MKKLESFAAAAAIVAIAVTGSANVGAVRFNSAVRGPSEIALVQQFDTNAQIVLMRGLANVFSLGLDDLAEKLKGYGYKPIVSNWKSASATADTIARNYAQGQNSPVILVGHSLGAGATFDIAEILRKKNIPVAYMVTYDLTAARTLPSNVKEYLNFYQRNGFGQKASPPPGYRGTMMNVDLSARKDLKHGNIDEAPGIHEIIMGKVFTITSRQ